MSTNDEIVETIIQKFTNELKNQASLSYAGHKNLWIDLGWDLSQGDREICNHVEEMLRLLVVNLPEDINEIIWSESWGGKTKINDIMESLNTKSYDFSKEGNAEADDIFEDIVEYLKDRIFIAAEAAYDQNQEIDSEEEYEDDDTEEEEDDEDGHENYDE
jgi:hypothetical protein